MNVQYTRKILIKNSQSLVKYCQKTLGVNLLTHMHCRLVDAIEHATAIGGF